MVKTILFASGTAATARAAVEEVAATEGYHARVLTRSPDSPKAQALAAIANVTVVKGDFEDAASVAAALEGVHRAMLVSAAGAHEQFDREADFLTAAQAAGVEAVVRVSTCSGLIHPGSRGVYARAHASLEAFIRLKDLPVIDLNPNWYMQNWLGNAAEAKAAGQITMPTKGTLKGNFIDVSDVGRAAAVLLLASTDALQPALRQRNVQVHGPAAVSLVDKAAILSKAVGYDIKLNTIPREAFIQVFVGFGLSPLFATSFTDTIRFIGGCNAAEGTVYNESSRVLYDLGWTPKVSVEDFVQSPVVQAAFRK